MFTEIGFLVVQRSFFFFFFLRLVFILLFLLFSRVLTEKQLKFLAVETKLYLRITSVAVTTCPSLSSVGPKTFWLGIYKVESCEMYKLISCVPLPGAVFRGASGHPSVTDSCSGTDKFLPYFLSSLFCPLHACSFILFSFLVFICFLFNSYFSSYFSSF